MVLRRTTRRTATQRSEGKYIMATKTDMKVANIASVTAFKWRRAKGTILQLLDPKKHKNIDILKAFNVNFCPDFTIHVLR